MKILGIVLLLIFLLLLAAEVIIVHYFVKMVTRPKMNPAEKQYERLIEKGCLKREVYETCEVEKEKFLLPSQYGYSLYCELLTTEESRRPENRSRVAVMCHGFTSCRYGMLPYAALYLKRGFSVIIYDHRNHGDSGKARTSMGYYEKYDLKSVVDWCYERFGEDVRLITHGGSMGAATVLYHLTIDDRIVCAVEDCGYSSFREQMMHMAVNKYKLPAFPSIQLIRLFIRLICGFDLNTVRPIDGAANSRTPILFIHGEEDDFVPTWMCRKMYDARTGPKRLFLVPGAGHAESIDTDPAGYERVLEEFLNTYYEQSDAAGRKAGC